MQGVRAHRQRYHHGASSETVLTTTSTLLLTHLPCTHKMVTQLMNNKDDVRICFMNFSKAFNILNHRIICANLTAFGVDWVLSSRPNRTFEVHIDNAVFGNAAVFIVVLQGSAINPLLFLVKVYDLPRDLQLFCRLFAGDTKLGRYEGSAEWTARNCVVLKARKHLQFERKQVFGYN